MALQYDPPLSILMDFFCTGTHQGFSAAEIQAAELRLGTALPPVYRDYLSAYGKDDVNYHFNQLQEPEWITTTYALLAAELDERNLEFQMAVDEGREAEYADNPCFRLWQLPPERWSEVTDNHAVIWYENQGVWSAGYRLQDLLDGNPDPPVYGSVNDDYVTYEKWTDGTEDFLREMLREAAYGWHGGQRLTKESEIQDALSFAGIDPAELKARGRSQGQGTCFLSFCLSMNSETLYSYYYTAQGYQELCAANRHKPVRNESSAEQRSLRQALQTTPKYRPFSEGPYRVELLPHQKKDLGMDRPRPADAIPLHPLIALLIQESFHHEPATAYDWGKDISKLKALKMELRYGTLRVREGNVAYIYPPGEHFPPPPYYFDLHDWSIIGRMTALQTLLIDRIDVDDQTLWPLLAKLPNLRNLRLQNLQAGDFSFLRECKALRSVSFYNTNFSDCRLLLDLPKLQEADLRFCPLEHREALEKLKARCRV